MVMEMTIDKAYLLSSAICWKTQILFTYTNCAAVDGSTTRALEVAMDPDLTVSSRIRIH